MTRAAIRLGTSLLVPLLLASSAEAQLIKTSQLHEVVAVQERWIYLDVVLKNPDFEWRFFFLPTEDCRLLMRVESVVEWAPIGVFGRIRLAGRECEPVGVGSLRRWRNRSGRHGDPTGVPRGRSEFEEVYRDEDYVLVLGRMPYAARIGFTGGERAVAMVPNSPECERPLADGRAMLEFRRGGQEPFRFSAGRGNRCVIEAFIQAPPPSVVEGSS